MRRPRGTVRTGRRRGRVRNGPWELQRPRAPAAAGPRRRRLGVRRVAPVHSASNRSRPRGQRRRVHDAVCARPPLPHARAPTRPALDGHREHLLRHLRRVLAATGPADRRQRDPWATEMCRGCEPRGCPVERRLPARALQVHGDPSPAARGRRVHPAVQGHGAREPGLQGHDGGRTGLLRGRAVQRAAARRGGARGPLEPRPGADRDAVALMGRDRRDHPRSRRGAAACPLGCQRRRHVRREIGPRLKPPAQHLPVLPGPMVSPLSPRTRAMC